MTISKKNAADILIMVVMIGLMLAMSFLLSKYLLKITGLTQSNQLTLIVGRLFAWTILLLLFIYTKASRQKILIWKEQEYRFSFYPLSVLKMFGMIVVPLLIMSATLSFFGLNDVSVKVAGLVRILKNNPLLLIFTALTAAVTEEFIFRGFMQTRIEAMTKSPFLGILISSILFAVVHLSYGTIGQFFGPAIIGVVLATFYWKYKNIKVVILMHFLWDLFALYLTIRNNK